MTQTPDNGGQALMADDWGHLNGIARGIGIRPECREVATPEEIEFARQWMKFRANAFREAAAARKGANP